jgi:hypothetical protein
LNEFDVLPHLVLVKLWQLKLASDDLELSVRL